jgi:COP9 signalosome complex subunit 6
LISLLGQLGDNVKHMRELGKKSMITESGKQSGAAAGGRKAHLALHSRFDEDRESVFANITNGGLQMM